MDYLDNESPLVHNLSMFFSGLCVLACIAIFTIFIRKCNIINMDSYSSEKIIQLYNYKKAVISRWRSIQWVTIACILAYIITRNAGFIVLSVILVLVTIALFPSKKRLVTDMKISKKDEHLLYY